MRLTRVSVIGVRDGVVPSGGADALAEADGIGIIIGSGTKVAGDSLAGRSLRLIEIGHPGPARTAAVLVSAIDADLVICPASPDGRDLAPRLALLLGRPLIAGAVEIRSTVVKVARLGGRLIEDHPLSGPCVVTLQPGVRAVGPGPRDPAGGGAVREVVPPPSQVATTDAELLTVMPPDPRAIDLTEADRIVGGGAGLTGVERFAQLADVGSAIGASMGVTRVITDRGWIDHHRQIGTTGVVVSPKLYLNFGVSGAVQHTAGLGDPHHVISVNTDPSCPMMAIADLAIVADANDVLEALYRILVAP